MFTKFKEKVVVVVYSLESVIKNQINTEATKKLINVFDIVFGDFNTNIF